MKIALITSSLGAGGAEKVLSLMSEYFLKNHEVFIITLGDEKSHFPLPKGAKIVALNKNRDSKNILDSIKNNAHRIKGLKNALCKIAPNVAISFMTETNIIAILSAKMARIPIIASEHTCYIWQKSHFWNILRRVFYPFANAVTLLTKKDMKNHYGFLKNCVVMPNPFDFSPKNMQKKEKVVLAVGRLIPDKGFYELIEAFCAIKNSNYHLEIAGEGADRALLEHLINKLNCKDRVRLLGQQKDIYAHYLRAEIFALSSHIEGLSNALIEALSMGCAVVSYDCPYGPSEVIENGKNGILVPLFDKKQLAKELENLMNNDELLQILSQNAPNIREKYALENVMPLWDSLIFSVQKS